MAESIGLCAAKTLSGFVVQRCSGSLPSPTVTLGELRTAKGKTKCESIFDDERLLFGLAPEGGFWESEPANMSVWAPDWFTGVQNGFQHKLLTYWQFLRGMKAT